MQPDITIITPWLDHPEFLADYEKAVAASGVQVIAVDNGSAADNARAICAMIQRVGGVYLRNEENRWFAEANNQGLAVATGRILLFLNNDIAAAPGWLGDVARDVTAGGLFAPDVKSVQIDQWKVAYLEGWCIAGQREVWQQLGGWNARSFKMPYWEDAELCIRATRAGVKLTQVAWRVSHKKNGTSGYVPGVMYGFEHNRSVITSLVRGQPLEKVAGISQPTNLEPLENYLRTGRLPEAEQAYRNATAAQPGRADLLMTYGQILRSCGRFEAAIAAMHRAMQMNPAYAADAWREIALSSMNAGKNPQAAAAFREVIARRPGELIAWTNLAIALNLSGQFDEAAEAARRAIAIKPTHAEAHVQLSDAMLRSSLPTEARGAAEQAIRLEPKSSAAHHALGKVLLAGGQLDDAVRTLTYAQMLDPHNGFIHVDLLEAQARLTSGN